MCSKKLSLLQCYQKFILPRSTISLLFKNYSLAEKNRFLGAQKFVLLKASSVEHYAPHNFVQLVTLRVTRGTRNIDITLVSLLLTLKRFHKFS